MGTLLWPNGSPSIPPISSEYGMRFHPIDQVWRLHAGIDEVGFSTVRSPVDGVVVYTRYNGGYGNLVKVREWSTGDEHWLAHNARFLIGEGAGVSAGDPVAIQGTTGASTGVHTHHEVHPASGGTVNPRDYYANRYSSPAGGGGTTLEEFLMSLSETQQRQVYEALVVGGQSADAYYMPQAIVNVLRTEISPAIAAIAAGGILFPGAGYAAFPALANAIREGHGDEAFEVDEAELATKLAPVLAPLLAENLGTLSDDTIDSLVKRLLDEQAKRLAS